MNTIALRCVLATVAVGALFLSALPSARADYKTGTGSACVPYGTTTTWDELRYLVGAVTPREDTDEFVLCNFASDAENGWYNAATEANVTLQFKAGSLDAPVSCTATAGSAYMYGVLTYTKSVTIPATLSSSLAINDILAPGSYSWVPFAVTCKLPARATLSRIVLHESGST